MARGRMINTTIAEDEKFNAMSVDAQFIFMRTLPHLDRDGLIAGNTSLLWARVAPLLVDYAVRMESIVYEWEDNGFAIRYNDGKRDVIFFPSFRKNQFGMRYEKEAPSQFACPPGYVRTSDGLVEKHEFESKINGNNGGKQGTDLGRTKDGKGTLEVEVEVEGEYTHVCAHEDENPPLFASLAESAPQAKETAQTAVTEKAQPQTQPEFRESLSGEYMPGLTRPKRYQMQTSVTQTVSDAQKFGVQPQQFREMVDCLLAGCAKRALADTDSPDGEQVLLHAQSTTLTLVKLDTRFRSVTGIQSIFDSWENNDFRGGTVPSSGQVLEHASKMVAGKVTCERKDKPQAKAEPIVVTEKQFIPDMMKPRAPIYAKVKPQ